MTCFRPMPPVIHLSETDSTSNYLAAHLLCENPEEFTIVRADYQTAGKGQRGNSWEAEAGKNLLFSILLYPKGVEARRQFLLSEAIALAIKEALDQFSSGFSIKWPNDIYWHEQKICGILLENDLLGNTIQKTVVGIGLNVNQQQFHSSAPNPVSLWQITRKEHDIHTLLKDITPRIIKNYTLLYSNEGAQEISNRYHDALFRKEGTHTYRDSAGEFKAKIECVKPEGTLVLKDEEGKERRYAFKEVQYK